MYGLALGYICFLLGKFYDVKVKRCHTDCSVLRTLTNRQKVPEAEGDQHGIFIRSNRKRNIGTGRDLTAGAHWHTGEGEWVRPHHP